MSQFDVSAKRRRHRMKKCQCGNDVLVKVVERDEWGQVVAEEWVSYTKYSSP